MHFSLHTLPAAAIHPKASLFTVVSLSDTFNKYSRCSPVVLVGVSRVSVHRPVGDI